MLIEEMLEELQEYADNDGTEIGEALSLMIQLAGYPDYVTDELYVLLERELLDRHADYVKNYVWVEEEIINTRIVRSLEER